MGPRRILLLAVAAAAVVVACYPEGSADVFWHLKTGQVILAEHRLVTTNLFSSLFPDHPWPNPEWLFEVALAGVYGIGGWEAVSVAKLALCALLGGALFAALGGRGRGAAGAAGAALLAVAVLALIRFRLAARPQLLSYLFFVVVVLVVERQRRRADATAWALPALFALWSNVHPEFVFGFGYLGARIVGDELDRRRFPVAAPGVAGRRLLVPALACVPATLLNPEGVQALLFPVLHLNLSPVIQVAEYSYSWPSVVPGFWVALALTAALLLVPGARRWGDLVPAAGTAVLGVMYIRAVPYFLFTAALLVLRRAYDFPEPMAPALRRWREAALAAGAAAALLWAFGSDRASHVRWGWGVDESDYPAAAADVLAARPFPPRLYNHYDDGGYLIWRLYPALGVFQDGRVQAYPREFLARGQSVGGEEGWARFFDDFGVNTVLARRGGHELLGVQQGWAVVFWDRTWVVLVRRAAAGAGFLERYEYTQFLPAGEPEALTDAALLPALVAEMQRNQRERRAPSAELAREIGVQLGRLGRREEAAAAFREARRIDPAIALP
jgi:hypothetical protein